MRRKVTLAAAAPLDVLRSIRDRYNFVRRDIKLRHCSFKEIDEGALLPHIFFFEGTPFAVVGKRCSGIYPASRLKHTRGVVLVL